MSISSARFSSRSPSRKAVTFAAKVKAIVNRTGETKRRAVVALFNKGEDMVITATGAFDEAYNNGLWLGSVDATTSMADPDNALQFPMNVVFGAIAQGDKSTEREGDQVSMTLMKTSYNIRLKWNPATASTARHQRITVLEFVLCIRDPVVALTMCNAMDDGGDDYSDQIMSVLVASGKIFDIQYTSSIIQAQTPAVNSTGDQSSWHRSATNSGIKVWNRDLTTSQIEHTRLGKAVGSVYWHKWHSYKRPTVAAPCQISPAYSTGLPLTAAGRVPVGELVAATTTASTAAYDICADNQSQIKHLGVTMRFKKPKILKYQLTVAGGEATPSIPTNCCLIYGTWWRHNSGEGATIKLLNGGVEQRWKDK